MSLKDGQFQIGDLKFGRGTNISIVGVDQVGYDVSPGDYGLPQSDEIRFRKDYIQPGVMQFSLAVVDNYILDSSSGITLPPGASSEEALEKLKMEWSADKQRLEWGSVKPLTYRGPGLTRVLYGRPRNFASGRRKTRSGWYGVTCSYQLADRLSYAEETTYEEMGVGEVKTLSRGSGLAPSWVSAMLIGPASSPVMQFGPHAVSVDTTIGAGEVLTLGSAPWQRFLLAYRSGGLVENVGAKAIDGSAYLEDIRFPEKSAWNVSFSAGGTSSQTEMVVGWQEAYHAV
jgi:hypothetical protein